MQALLPNCLKFKSNQLAPQILCPGESGFPPRTPWGQLPAGHLLPLLGSRAGTREPLVRSASLLSADPNPPLCPPSAHPVTFAGDGSPLQTGQGAGLVRPDRHWALDLASELPSEDREAAGQ